MTKLKILYHEKNKYNHEHGKSDPHAYDDFTVV